MSRARVVWRLGLFLLLSFTSASSARALPGFYVGKNAEKRSVHEVHLVLMRKADASVVTVMPDYEGPLSDFALVLAVPSDVTLDKVRTLKRQFVDRVDQISAPRFHEWWEEDPCEPGEVEQEWERSLKADPAGAFLGGGGEKAAGTGAIAKELFANVKSDYKQGEYTFSLVRAGQSLESALKDKGYQVSAEVTSAVLPYAKAGMSFVIAEVDSKRVELVGGGRAQLSPVRFSSSTPIESLPVRLGLVSADGPQELFVYVLHPDTRYQAKNYQNVFPPTNIEVDFSVKERMGEFYAGLHDLLLHKNAEGVLNEFAWHSAGCGEPCPNAALEASEILSLGGDVFEASLPAGEQKPEPPPPTEEERKREEAIVSLLPMKDQPLRRLQFSKERRIIFRNKGILERQKYIISRIHHRYDKSGLPRDLELAPAAPVRGGVSIPKGEKRELPQDVATSNENRWQLRYTSFHPWQGTQKCEGAKRFRWGKAPRTYRGLRKIWVAEDLSRKNRTQIQPVVVIKTPVPALGLAGQVEEILVMSDDAGDGKGQKSKNCGCSVPGAGSNGVSASALLAAALTWMLRRRLVG